MPSELREKASCILQAGDTLSGDLEPQNNVFWTKPTVRADQDLFVRRWPRCDSQPNEGPLLTHCENGMSIAALAAVVSRAVQCERDSKENCWHSGLVTKLKDLNERKEFRIVYTLPWNHTDAPPIFEDGAPLLTRVSAKLFEDESTRVPSEWTNRIVIIGGSFAAAQDIHQTPIGPMPGAMIIANAIHSLQGFDVVSEAGPLHKFAIAVIPIIGTAFVMSINAAAAFSRYEGFGGEPFVYFVAIFNFAKAIVAIVFVILLFEASLRLFPIGTGVVWLDATLPCIGVIIHQWFEEEPKLTVNNGVGANAAADEPTGDDDGPASTAAEEPTSDNGGAPNAAPHDPTPDDGAPAIPVVDEPAADKGGAPSPGAGEVRTDKRMS